MIAGFPEYQHSLLKAAQVRMKAHASLLVKGPKWSGTVVCGGEALKLPNGGE